MALWLTAAALALALVGLWTWAEHRFQQDLGAGERLITAPWLLGKLLLLAVLTVALHGAIDPDHDRRTFQVYSPSIARGVYALAVTGALLFAFPRLRIWAGALLMIVAISGMEGLQMLGILPGRVRIADWLTALLGVAVAAVPMWVGAHRARRNMARELAEAPSARGRDKDGGAPI